MTRGTMRIWTWRICVWTPILRPTTWRPGWLPAMQVGKCFFFLEASSTLSGPHDFDSICPSTPDKNKEVRSLLSTRPIFKPSLSGPVKKFWSPHDFDSICPGSTPDKNKEVWSLLSTRPIFKPSLSGPVKKFWMPSPEGLKEARQKAKQHAVQYG